MLIITKEEIQNIFDTPIQKSAQTNSFSSNIFETSVEVNSNANYTLTVTNTYGCSSISTPIK